MEFFEMLFARHVQSGRKIIIRSPVALRSGDVIPYLDNASGERFTRPFVVVRESDLAEFEHEMAPAAFTLPPMKGARYFEVTAD